MKKFDGTFVSLALASLILLNFFNNNLNASERNMADMGQLHGKIIAPQGTDFSSIIIQVIGANQTDPFLYYTSPKPNGEFSFDHILPAKSTVQLYIWDGAGLLDRTITSAYVSPRNQENIGVYEIVMHEMQYTQDLSSLQNIEHNFTKAGFCGVFGNQANLQFTKILVYDRMAKFLGPIQEQTLNSKNQFCFFNLDSPTKSDMYDFVLTTDSTQTKTFTYYLPSTTFVHNAYLDVSSALYRPIQPFVWQESYLNTTHAKWESLDTLKIATSDDYSFVSFNKNRQQDNLFYFPLSNDLLEVKYAIDGESADHFFTLIPRAQLMNGNKSKIINIDATNNIYADYTHPYPVKVASAAELSKMNANFYAQTWSEQFGAAFLTIDLAQLGLENKNDFVLSLRNIAGQEVGNFEELILEQDHHFSGFFLNLLPGRYQVFLTRSTGELLWTYEVRSYANKVQIITNDGIENVKQYKNLVQEIYKAKKNEYKSFFVEENYQELTDTTAELALFENEQMLIQNNNLYSQDLAMLCNKKPLPSFLDKLVNLEHPL